MWSHFVQWPADCFDPPEGVENRESGHCSCNFVQFLNDLRESLVQLFYPGTWGTVTYTVLKLISTTLLCGLRHVWFCQFLFECSIISSCCQLSEHMYLNYKVRQHLVITVGLDCSYELGFQCELTLQTQLISTIQPNRVHQLLPDLVFVRFCFSSPLINHKAHTDDARVRGYPSWSRVRTRNCNSVKGFDIERTFHDLKKRLIFTANSQCIMLMFFSYCVINSNYLVYKQNYGGSMTYGTVWGLDKWPYIMESCQKI